MTKNIVTIPPGQVLTSVPGKEVEISNTLKWGSTKTWHLEFKYPAGTCVSSEPDPWLVLTLLPAMRCGLGLEFTGPVSGRLLQNLSGIQAILNQWNPAFQKIEIKATPRPYPAFNRGRERKVGCFFTGGVDSFYTILNHLAEIDTLIYLDNPYAQEAARARMNGKIEQAARQLGKSLIIVKSNFREFLDGYVDWDFSHGAAIITLAHFLAPYLSKVYIASGRTFSNFSPNGTHPLLDPLWSSEDLEVAHDGDEATRQQKVDFVSQNEIVLHSLRVCWQNIENELNCGRCYKCLHTMVSLRVAGTLDRCTAFARPLDLEFLSNAAFPKLISRRYLLESLELLEERGDDLPLQAALRKCLANQKLLTQLKQVAGVDPELVELRQKVDYYEKTLRFQIVERMDQILGRNPTLHRLGEIAAHQFWKIIK